MKESPLYEEIMQEGRIEKGREGVQGVLMVRFGKKAATFATAICEINDEATLFRLHRLAIRCRNVAEFKQGLSEEAGKK